MKTRKNNNGTPPKRDDAPKPSIDGKSLARLARQIAKEMKQGRRAAKKNQQPKANLPVIPPPPVIPTQPPHYGTGLHFDTPGLHYAAGDPPTPPVNDGGKARTDLNNKTDAEVVDYIYMHIKKMAGNENFSNPQPTAVDFQALADNFANAVTGVTAAKNNLTQAILDREAARAAMDAAGWSIRVPYVQIASNGNSAVIASSGLSVRSAPTPTGVLPPPENFRVDLNDIPGAMFFSCNPVPKARGYVIQFADASTMERDWKPFATMNSTRYSAKNMEIGKTFAFRIATTGGSTSQSDWSMEIVRTAA